jgi:hypothetical protein
VVAEGLTTTEVLVDKVLQVYVVAPLTVKLALEPEQMAVVPVIDTVGFGFTLIVLIAVLEQVPLAPITLKVVVVVKEGATVAVVAPVFQV